MDPDTTTSQPEADSAQEDSSAESLKQVLNLFSEWRAYLGYYLSARIDGIKQGLFKGVLLAALALVAGIVFMVGLSTAAVLLVAGLAGAVGEAVGRPWLGNIIVGGGLLVLVGVGLLIGRSIAIHSWQRSMVKKYEERQTKQHERFGHDIHQRATAHRQSSQA